MNILLRWNPLSGAIEMATVTSAPVLQCKMRCMSVFTAKVRSGYIAVSTERGQLN